MIYIGIDPGQKTGVAIWDSREKKLALRTYSFWDTIKFFDDLLVIYHPIGIIVYIENPGTNNFMFGEKIKGKNTSELTKIARNVGENIAHAKLIMQYCEIKNIAYKSVAPKTPKWGDKKNHNLFRTITGYKGKATPHEMDAAHLVYGF